MTKKIYPVNTSSFGFEWKPGIDGDEKITLLMFDIKDGYNGSGGFVGGYFFAGDEYMQSQIPANIDVKTNEREMFYLDINPSDPTKDHYMAVVAHEFQHMIHFNHDPKENTWVNEACSQIAPYLCGFGHASQITSYMKTPDNSLTAWSQEQMLANYGQVYLWNYYIFNRFLGRDNSKAGVFFKKLVDSKKQGIDGYSTALKEFKAKFTDTFDKFAITNFVNNPKLAENDLYNYDKTLGRLKLPVTQEVRAFPGKVQNEVFLWSSDCIDVDLSAAKEEMEIIFGGTRAKFSEGKYNSFTVAAVLMNSRDKAKPFVRFLEILPIDGKNLQAGSLKFAIEKDYDSLKLVVIAHAPESIPDKAYAKAPAMKYFVQFNDKGEQVERIAASVDSLELLKNYSRTSASLDSSNEVALNIALTNLESLNYKFSEQIKQELENGKLDSLRSLVEGIESGNVDKNSVRPLIKQASSVGAFHLQQNQDFAELESLLDKINSL